MCAPRGLCHGGDAQVPGQEGITGAAAEAQGVLGAPARAQPLLGERGRSQGKAENPGEVTDTHRASQAGGCGRMNGPDREEEPLLSYRSQEREQRGRRRQRQRWVSRSQPDGEEGGGEGRQENGRARRDGSRERRPVPWCGWGPARCPRGAGPGGERIPPTTGAFTVALRGAARGVGGGRGKNQQEAEAHHTDAARGTKEGSAQDRAADPRSPSPQLPRPLSGGQGFPLPRWAHRGPFLFGSLRIQAKPGHVQCQTCHVPNRCPADKPPDAGCALLQARPSGEHSTFPSC